MNTPRTNEEMFYDELRGLINRYGYDNLLNVPDYILADYLCKALLNISGLISKRDIWFQFEPNKQILESENKESK